EDHRLIVSSLHVHIDHDNCLEVIIFKGPNTRIKAIADRLTATRGVKHGKLTMSTTGHDL
ncbi:MAG: nickel-responsive transcriptional regulator NikR, partial [Gemmatimonadota bacterium]|nr:nickel-responsive transcriptional regulator NikR [Gemmatimonadota bacterium]